MHCGSGKGGNISLFSPLLLGLQPARGVRPPPDVYLGYVNIGICCRHRNYGHFTLQANVRDSCASPYVSRIRVHRVAAGTEHIYVLCGYLAIASILT